jgi:hypothetical protein
MKLKYLLFVTLIFVLNTHAFAQWEVQPIDINNISAPVEADGFLFYNTNTQAHFEVPKFSGKYCINVSNLWMGGYDQIGALHFAGNEYKVSGTDYWPGPLTTNGSVMPPASWNKIWHIDRGTIDNHIANYNTQGYQLPDDIAYWPGSTYNNINQIFAPFADVNNNGIYDPSYGDYPNVPGDEALYLMYNDKFASHGETSGIPIEAEVYTTVYAYNSTGSSIIDQTVFVRHRIRNRSQQNTYTNFFAGMWNDFDIGDKDDDYIGTDIGRNMVYGYNADDTDAVYGKFPPAAAMKILNHSLHNSMYYSYTSVNNTTGAPNTPNEYYNYLQSFWKDNTPLSYGQNGYLTGQGNTPYCFSGNTNPNYAQPWNANTPEEFRIIGTAGPFTLAPNGFITLDVAYIYARGNNGNSIIELQVAADVVQNFYNAIANETTDYAEKNNLSLFPNPAHDYFTIQLKDASQGPYVMQISDLSGKILLTEKISTLTQQSFDISHLNKGIYFITLNNNTHIYNQKLIIN